MRKFAQSGFVLSMVLVLAMTVGPALAAGQNGHHIILAMDQDRDRDQDRNQDQDQDRDGSCLLDEFLT